MNHRLSDGAHHITAHDVDNSAQNDVQAESLPRALQQPSDDVGLRDDIATSWEHIFWPEEDGADQIFDCNTSATSPDVAMSSRIDVVEAHFSDDLDKIMTGSTTWAWPSAPFYTPSISIEPEIYSTHDGGIFHGGTLYSDPMVSHPSTNSATSNVDVANSPYAFVLDDLDATSDILDLGSEGVPEMLVCSMCNTIFRGKYRKGNLARHENIKHHSANSAMYFCKENSCRKGFKRPDARLKHYRRHHPELTGRWSSGVTPVRGRSVTQDRDPTPSATSSIGASRRHSLAFMGKEAENEDISAYTASELLSTLEDSSKMISETPTTMRDLHLGSLGQDDDEIRTASDSRVTCSLCESTFQRPADLRRHMQKHEDPMFPCEVTGCKREFYRMDKLRDHVQKTHRGTVSTTDEGSLRFKVAKAAQNAEQPSSYKCTDCSLEFRTPGLRMNHFNRKHNKRYKCDDCEQAFGLRKDLERHRATRHKALLETTYHCTNKDCPTPDKKFTRKDNFARHVQRCQKKSSSDENVQSGPLPPPPEDMDTATNTHGVAIKSEGQ
jgi:hypothetical protein